MQPDAQASLSLIVGTRIGCRDSPRKGVTRWQVRDRVSDRSLTGNQKLALLGVLAAGSARDCGCRLIRYLRCHATAAGIRQCRHRAAGVARGFNSAAAVERDRRGRRFVCRTRAYAANQQRRLKKQCENECNTKDHALQILSALFPIVNNALASLVFPVNTN